MLERDRRRVSDLLADTDALARETLLDVSPDAAPAMLRTFVHLVQSAARVSSLVPPSTTVPTSEPDVMVRLQAVGRGIGRSVAVSRWPGPGATDDRMSEMAENLTRAAVLVESHGWDVQTATPDDGADIQTVRGRVIHAVYLAAHGTAVAVTGYVNDLRERLETATRRNTRLSERPSLKSVPAAQSFLSRLDVFEQLAASYVSSHPVGMAGHGSAPAAPGMPLESALARWDIQAHRTLASQPAPPDLVRVARTQALIATTAVVVTAAAADQGKVDRDAVQRLTPSLEAAQVEWTLTANQWSRVRSPNGHTDHLLLRAASDLRSAVAATAYTPNGWASPSHLAEHLDLAETVKILQLGMVASVDVAYVMREVAAIGHGATVPPQAMTTDAQGQPVRATDLGYTRPHAGLGATPRQPAPTAARLDPLRRRLVNQADVVIATANSAVAATASLTPTTPRPAAQPKSQKRSNIEAQKRNLGVGRPPVEPRR